MSVSPSPGSPSTTPIVRGSLGGLTLRAALKRGALVTAANWPVVLVQFVAVSLCRVAVAVPIVGGAFMVAVLSEGDVRWLFADGVSSAAGLVVASLLHRPIALWSFLTAVGLVALGAGVVSWLAQAGVMDTLVRGGRAAADLQRPPLREDIVGTAGVSSFGGFMTAVSRFGRRFVMAGTWLYAGYAVITGSVIASLALATRVAERAGWSVVLPLTVIGATAGALVVVAVLQLVYALLQSIMLTDDCRLSTAVARLRPFLVHDARQILGIFGVVLVLLVLATAASVLATAGLALVAWVPLVGLAVIPLQLAAWLLRGIVFHYVDLSAWSAYQSEYRRYAKPAAARMYYV